MKGILWHTVQIKGSDVRLCLWCSKVQQNVKMLLVGCLKLNMEEALISTLLAMATDDLMAMSNQQIIVTGWNNHAVVCVWGCCLHLL